MIISILLVRKWWSVINNLAWRRKTFLAVTKLTMNKGSRFDSQIIRILNWCWIDMFLLKRRRWGGVTEAEMDVRPVEATRIIMLIICSWHSNTFYRRRVTGDHFFIFILMFSLEKWLEFVSEKCDLWPVLSTEIKSPMSWKYFALNKRKSFIYPTLLYWICQMTLKSKVNFVPSLRNISV